MTARGKRPRIGAAALAVIVAGGLAACGDEDFKNDPRPPVTIDLTGVIQSNKVTVSPASVGAGPVAITIANQTDDPHTISLRGGSIDTTVGPVAPTDTATIRRTLERGEYEVSAGGEAAVPREIKPATLEVGAERKSGSTDLQLP
ncbi:MAG: hypothetical protein JW895_11480 [Thermoleophilaceae bacterium]|nr:hypothetical protein [Thermoleophilaceae bacterium]